MNEEEKIFEIRAETNMFNMVIAEYKTKERAKEVLNEFNERYSNWENFLAGQPQGICSPKYEMPLE